jgi:Uncharacterized membrane protein (homolog of Drosophila rhomboid)
MNGQWWRCITALTLHGDSRHLGGNLLTGYLVLSMMSYRISLAKVVPFLAVSSALANFCVAATVHTDFRSLGFSTFVFAAIGALSVMEFRLMPKESHGLLRRFAPLCGAASLATFVGIGEHADILAHLYGFIAGLLCGFIPSKKSLRWGGPLRHRIFSGLSPTTPSLSSAGRSPTSNPKNKKIPGMTGEKS